MTLNAFEDVKPMESVPNQDKIIEEQKKVDIRDNFDKDKG